MVGMGIEGCAGPSQGIKGILCPPAPDQSLLDLSDHCPRSTPHLISTLTLLCPPCFCPQGDQHGKAGEAGRLAPTGECWSVCTHSFLCPQGWR